MEMITIQIKYSGQRKNFQFNTKWLLRDLQAHIESLFPQLKEQIKYQAYLKSKNIILFTSDSIERLGDQQVQQFQITDNDSIGITVTSSPQTKEQLPRVTSQNWSQQNKILQRPYKVTQKLFECEKCKKLQLQLTEYQEKTEILHQKIQEYIHQIQTQERKIDKLTNLNKRQNVIYSEEFSQTIDDFKSTKQRHNFQLVQKNQSLQAELTTIKIEQKEKALDDQAVEFNKQIQIKNQEILCMKQYLTQNQTSLEDRKKLYDLQESIFQEKICSKDYQINILTKDLEKKTLELQKVQSKIDFYKNNLIQQIQNG